ncbi:MAG: hypothetical protein VX498_14520, partial [Myxococcota bacterium]|nr:hypothetical protein [Myxococcota bacterium]
MRIPAPLLAVLTASFLLPATASAVTPEQLVETANRLDTRRLDTSQRLPAQGQVLQRTTFKATFSEGSFFPIRREDNRVVGMIFDGLGEVQFTPPEGTEREGWDRMTEGADTRMAFGAAHLSFTDATLLDLTESAEWIEEKDTTGKSFRIFEARRGLHEDPRWSRWNPGLLTDQLMDLMGGGHVGGHLLAEFRPAGKGARSWISALENPRGALLPGEAQAIFQVKADGDSPPRIDILSSWGKSPEAVMHFDVVSTSIDINFPTSRPALRKLSVAEVSAELQLVSLGVGGPLKAVILELEGERRFCEASSQSGRLKIKRVVDGEGRGLGAVHRGNRLFIPLAKALAQGETVTIRIDYEGPMTEGSGDFTLFKALGPWAWYPRNLYPDRFGSRVEAHMPRYLRAVAPGALEEERLEKDGWHFVFAEPSGVANLTLVVGDLIRSPDKEHGEAPKIIIWKQKGDEKYLDNASRSSRKMVDFVSQVWGPYPYSTLHVVDHWNRPLGNWEIGETGGSWTCVPPNQTRAWQGFVDAPSGVILDGSPVTAPAEDLNEAKALNRLFVTPVAVNSFIDVVTITRQWWGHMVLPRSERDLWIGEAIALWTGGIFTRAAMGKEAFKERMEIQRELMTDSIDEAGPLARGSLLGRQFAPQVWGRGPSSMVWLADRMGPKVFFNAFNGLLNRSSMAGIDTKTLLETIATHTDSSVADQFRLYIEDNTLPTVEYSS